VGDGWRGDEDVRATLAVGLTALVLASCSGSKPQEYANKAWGFAITFPGQPKVTETAAKGAAPASVLAESHVGADDFAVNVIDARSATATPDQLLADAPKVIASGMGVDVGAVTYAATDDVTGRQVRLDSDGKPVVLLRIFYAGGRLYEISANSAKGVADPAVSAFLGSFRLLEPPAPAAPSANSAAASNAAANANP
jgi:hypothetical protein